jgi:hypothetical protein
MATSDDIAQLEIEFGKVIDLLRRGVQEVIDGYNNLVNKANDTLRKIAFASIAAGLYVRHRLQEILNRLRGLLTALVDKCREMIDRATPIYALFRAGFAWETDIRRLVSGKQGVAAADAHSNLANWKGPAQDAYRRRVPLQVSAVAATASTADAVAAWLVDLASANVKVVIALADPLVPIAAKLVEATIDAGSVVGALEAIDSVAEAVGKLLEVVWAELKVAIDDATNIVGKMHSARRIIDDKGAFPNGHWPEAVTI